MPAGAHAAEAAPRWHVSSFRSFPTVLARGSAASGGAIPQITAAVVNVGGGAASAPVRVVARLPEGLSTSASSPPTAGSEECETPSAREAVCELDETALPEGGLRSGEELVVSIPLEVAGSAPSPALTHLEVSGGSGARAVSRELTTAIGGSPPPFGFLEGSGGLSGLASTGAGLDASLAGSHPYVALLESNFNSVKKFDNPYPVEDMKDLELHLPRGLVVNPQAPTVRCAEAELATQTANGEGGCPRASQIGQITVETVIGGPASKRNPLFDMQPPPGVAAELGFNVLGSLIHIEGGLDGDFHLTGASKDILAKYSVLGMQVELWGNPAAPGHDRVRYADNCPEATGCSIEAEEANKVPFLTMPASCGEPLSLGADVTSWEGNKVSREAVFTDAEGNPLTMSGCNALAFEPSVSSKATTDQGDSPTGLDFSIHQPQSESLEGRSTAPLKNARVTLPEGMTVNPAAANGLGSCTEEQSCPGASKIGTMQVSTPLLDHKLAGSIFLAKPYANPFGSLLSIYLAVEDEQSGITTKLAGKVSPTRAPANSPRRSPKTPSCRSTTSSCTSSTAPKRP